jgi:translation initiation factor 2B subunit (eIF-2B alpha/beta/delta family)
LNQNRIRWAGFRLEEGMQTRLTERVERIATDDRHGASWLAREAVEAVAEAIELGEDPLPLARELVRARPAMGAIAGALGRVIAAGRSPEQMADEARALVEARERAAKAIAVLLSPYIEGVVMTHSASATVKEALVHTPPERVVCTVSEPGGEGRELVEELRGEGLTADLVDDPDAEHAVGTVNLLLIGADTVFRDGSLVNKVGTTDLAKAAKKAGVPVMVACEVIKLSPAEARDPGEERFDLTEPRYIDRYVTEEGEWPPEDIAVLIDRTPFLREGHALLFGEQE